MNLLKRTIPTLPDSQMRFIAVDLVSRVNERIITYSAPPEVFKFGEKSKARKIVQPRTEKPKVVWVVRKREHNKYCSVCIAKENPVENTCRYASSSNISMGIPEAKKMRTSLTCDAGSASNKSPLTQNVFDRRYSSRKSVRDSKDASFSSKNVSHDSIEKIVISKKEEQCFNRRSSSSRFLRNDWVEKFCDSMSDCIGNVHNALNSLKLNMKG
ncbi:hypothetical protein JTB14_008949 [Gonioctena quinquepunctata]|nr:hypothetical protein JTB14_008949 [Gonioctena quinquepunctata]